jgi:hypothetical protein
MKIPRLRATRLYLLAGIALVVSTANAFENYDAHIGAASRLTCAQFNRLNQAEHDGALSWAFGFYSGLQSAKLNRMREKKPSAELDADSAFQRFDTRELAWVIERRCREQPNAHFVDIVGSVYAAGTELVRE